MPGILKMNSSANRGPDARDVDSKKRTHDGNMVNGERNVVRKDSPASAPAVQTPPNPNTAAPANGPVSAALSAPEPAPEIPHIDSSAYSSLSKLIQRVSQETYNELCETLVQMSELQPPQPNGNMTNGLGPLNGQEAEKNKQKKILVMRFAHDNRAKFIKLLVLTEWGKKASVEVSKLVDIMTWGRGQQASMDDIDGKIEGLKVEMNTARQFNPDIRTALEILGKKKAEWIPHMGLIPPPPMTPDKAIQLLRYMNTSLSTRLIVHENVPQQLSKWRIANGRVTFTVDGEFEFDLMSFVEDSSDQFHFIDFRLLFSPTPVIAAGSRFFNRLKQGVDNLLRDEGLEACFGYLHNVTLSHKIFTLAAQANKLVQHGWSGSLRSEFAHRVLWIQYWVNRPGKKSWLEIGVSSNRPKDGKSSWRGPPIPSISVRWFREGVHVQDVDLDFDWNHLSVERMVKRVIALHVGHVLRAAHQTFNPNIVTQATLSETEPSDCRLDVSVGSRNNTCTLSVEPITGRYTLRPATPLSVPAENAINRSLEASTTSSTITQLLARSILESIQRYAQQIGWQSVARHALRMEVVKAALHLDVLRFTLFRPRGWSANLALAAIVDASGESWWICELGEKGSTIVHAQKLVVDNVHGRPPPINRATLLGLGRVAVQQLAYSVTTRALSKEGKAFSLRYEFAPSRGPTASQGIMRGWVLHVKASDLIASKPGEDRWLEPAMQITGQGMRSDYRHVWHIATGTMVPSVAAYMQKLMSASPQTTFSFSEGGKFSILLSTPFGQEFVSELRARLRDLDRLRSFATTLEKRRMRLLSSSLEQVSFLYSKELSVTVVFGKGAEIKVEFGDKNPHRRIHSFLTDLINERSPGAGDPASSDNNSLDLFCATLLYSRPLLTTLSAIENHRPGNVDNPAIHARSVESYRVTYANPPCSFDISLKTKEDRDLWLIEDNDTKPADLRPKIERHPGFKRPDNLKAALEKLFAEHNEHWFGSRTGMVAELDGVPHALRRLHQTVIACYVEGGFKLEAGNASGGPPPTTQGKGPGSAPGPPSRPGGKNAPNAKTLPPARAGGANREVITID